MKQQDLKPALIKMGFQINDVPKQLYKYTGCNKQNQEKKLKDLQAKKVWLCYAANLNDPFEGLSLYIDELKLKESGWKEEDIKGLNVALKNLGNTILIGSFAASGLEEDMPLWAHYAYDHKGYCLEYEVIEETYIYPVLYENKRHLATKTLSDFLRDAKRLRSSEESVERFLVIWSSFMIKHSIWRYEKEYRILKYEENENNDNIRGQCFDEEELGLSLKAIYIGEKCSCKEELIKLGEERRCELYQMMFNPYEAEFKLTAQKLAATYT